MVRLIGQFPQRLGQFVFGEAVEQIGAGLRDSVVHPHIERTFMLVAHPALGIVDLHARNAEVGEDDIEAVELLLAEHLGDAGEIAVIEAHRHALLAQAAAGALQLGGIDIQADQSSAGPDSSEEFQGMPAVADGAVHDDVARSGFQVGHDLLHQHGHVRAGRRVALGPQMGLDLRIRREIVLLVLLGVALRVGAAVAGPPPVLSRRLPACARPVPFAHPGSEYIDNCFIVHDFLCSPRNVHFPPHRQDPFSRPDR